MPIPCKNSSRTAQFSPPHSEANRMCAREGKLQLRASKRARNGSRRARISSIAASSRLTPGDDPVGDGVGKR